MKKKIITQNKKAKFNFEILKEFEAGLELKGSEVKAIRNNQMTLLGSYIKINNSEAFLVESQISNYKFSSIEDYNPKRNRKLLLKKSEIEKLEKELNTSGVTIVPLEVYLKNNLVKISIALARGKKKYDKRQSIKKRDIERKLQQKFK